MDIVVTGMGTLNALGTNPETTWEQARSGQTGLTARDHDLHSQTIFGHVDWPGSDFLDERQKRRLEPFVQFAVDAAGQALRDAGLLEGEADEIGAYIGTSVGGIETTIKQGIRLREQGERRVAPSLNARVPPNMAAAMTAQTFDLHGPAFAPTATCATANVAISQAAALLQTGRVECMLAGGTQVLAPTCTSGFVRMRALSDAETVNESIRPFDDERSGFVPGNGAGVLLIETREHARKRDASPYARLAGYGNTSDAHHATRPDESGRQAARAIEQAAEGAIDYINAHGTGTALNGPFEIAALRRALNDKPPLSSTKGYTGHTIAAAGGVEAILTIKMLNENTLLPTLFLDQPDEDCAWDHVMARRDATIERALSNSFGFGGHNSVLCFETL